MRPDAKAYFPHVDGLRTIAVFGVLLAHFQIPGFPGGFLGVDVFFVISGYLISRLIIQERGRTGAFSFSRFYLRRVRRLLPAALTVIALSYLAFQGILGDKELTKFLKSIPFAIFSLANVNFYLDVGYFDTAARFKPLLHMWSLAVEEQFYLIWPAALLLMLHLRKALLPFAILLSIVSIGAAELMFSANASATYYLLPFRAFELLIGAVLATLAADQSPDHRDISLPAPWEVVLAWTGVSLIVGAYVFLDETSRMPGVLSLAPCVGAALVIAYGHGGLVGRFLTWRPIVWLGLISYSLYLVHWPLVAYVSYRLPDTPPLAVRLALFPISIGLAALSYYFIEERFRHPLRSGGRFREAPFMAAICAAMAVLCLPYVGQRMGLGKQPPLRAQNMRFAGDEVRQTRIPLRDSPTNASIVRIAGKNAPAGSPRVLILGDSHAQHLRYGAAALLLPRGYTVDLLNLPGCPPLFNVTRRYAGGAKRRADEDVCRKNAKAKRNLALSGQYKAIILASRWDPMFEPGIRGMDFYEDKMVAPDDQRNPTRQQSRALFESALADTVNQMDTSKNPLISA